MLVDLKLSFFLITLVISFTMLIQRRIKAIDKHQLYILLLFVFIFFHSLIFLLNDLTPTINSIESMVYFLTLFLLVITLDRLLIEKLLNVFFKFSLYIVLISSNVYLFLGNKTTIGFHGIFKNPNELGLFVSVFLLPYVFFAINKQKNVKSKVYFSLILINLVFILIMTASRGSLLTFLIIFFLFYKRKFKFKLLHITSVLIFVSSIVLLGLQSNIQSKAMQLVLKSEDPAKSVFLTRLPLWSLRIDGITDSPLYGSGFLINNHTFYDSYNEFPILEKGNSYLAIIEEFGLIFGMPIIIFIFWVVNKTRRIFNLPEYIPFILLAALIGLNFETWLFIMYGKFAWLFWFLLLFSFKYKTVTPVTQIHRIKLK